MRIFDTGNFILEKFIFKIQMK